MSTGLVHDHLLVMRGAERTFAAIADVWPDAPIYTLVYDEETTDGRFAGREVHSSMVQGATQVRHRGFRRMQRLFAWAVRRLPVSRHDLVISSSTGFALGVRPHRDAAHGIAAVEAQAAGRPVVGLDAGGLRETVVQGQTGVLVEEPTPEALADALQSVDFGRFDPAAIAAHARQFSVERFRRELRRHVDRVVAGHALSGTG
ncbi:MAG TPA: glycosyltransferase [Thermoleophilaceae bacterium]